MDKLRKKTTPRAVIEYAEKEDSNIYKFAGIVSRSVDNGKCLKSAIELQSKFQETKREGRFYTLFVQNRDHFLTSQAKIKEYLLSTTDKDTDVGNETDKCSKKPTKYCAKAK